MIRTTFDDGSGLDIYQLNQIDEVKTGGRRGKEWSVLSKTGQENFSFVTIVFPFETFDKRIEEENPNPPLKGWKINDAKWKSDQAESLSLSKGELSIFFSVRTLQFEGTIIEFEEVVDVLVDSSKGQPKIQLLNSANGHFKIIKKE